MYIIMYNGAKPAASPEEDSRLRLRVLVAAQLGGAVVRPVDQLEVGAVQGGLDAGEDDSLAQPAQPGHGHAAQAGALSVHTGQLPSKGENQQFKKGQ